METRAITLASDTPKLKDLLARSRDSLEQVLPKHLTAERLLKVVSVAVSKTPKLQKCTADSIIKAVLEAGQLGLDCSGVLGSAYLVPFWNKDIGNFEAKLIPGYRGLIDLARRSGEIDSIEARVVYAQDEFEIEYGSNGHVKHVPNFNGEQRDEDIRGCYMIAWLKGAARPQIEYLTKHQIEQARAVSKSGSNDDGSPKGPWRDWYGEMARKTAIKRGIKYLPVSVELARAVELDDDPNAEPTSTVPIVSSAPTSWAEQLTEKLRTRKQLTEQPPTEPVPPAQEPEATDTEASTPATPPPPSEPTPEEAWAIWCGNLLDAHTAAGGTKEQLKAVLDAVLLKSGKKGKGHETDGKWRAAMAEVLRDRRGVFAYLAPAESEKAVETAKTPPPAAPKRGRPAKAQPATCSTDEAWKAFTSRLPAETTDDQARQQWAELLERLFPGVVDEDMTGENWAQVRDAK